MFAIVVAVLFAIGQAQTAQTAQTAAERAARTARKEAAAALEAKAQADGAVGEALAELDRIRAQTAEQLAACQTATEQAQTAARAARAELEELRAAAAQAVTAAQEAAEAAVQKAIADRDRGLAERAAEMRQQIQPAKSTPKRRSSPYRARSTPRWPRLSSWFKAMRGEFAAPSVRQPARRSGKQPPKEPPS